MIFSATKHPVSNRGVPPEAFLAELVAWGRTADESIFTVNANPGDVFTSVRPNLGPWVDIAHRRAVLLEIMRVLAGFESSWNWNEGRDNTNGTSTTAVTIEAGAWQVSANSMGFGPDLRSLVVGAIGTDHGTEFQRAMKANHPLAMEYIARLLRHTCAHNGPVLRKEINPWLSRAAVAEFEGLLA